LRTSIDTLDPGESKDLSQFEPRTVPGVCLAVTDEAGDGALVQVVSSGQSGIVGFGREGID
jgi:hypothetical protein